MGHDKDKASDASASEASSSSSSASGSSSGSASSKKTKTKKKVSKKSKNKPSKSSKSSKKDKVKKSTKDKESKPGKRGPRGAQWMKWKKPYQEGSAIGQLFALAEKKGGVDVKKFEKAAKQIKANPSFMLRKLKKGHSKGFKWDVDDAHGRLRITGCKLVNKKWKKE